MVGVAQLVRASDCGSEGRGFESPHSPFTRGCGPGGRWNRAYVANERGLDVSEDVADRTRPLHRLHAMRVGLFVGANRDLSTIAKSDTGPDIRRRGELRPVRMCSMRRGMVHEHVSGSGNCDRPAHRGQGHCRAGVHWMPPLHHRLPVWHSLDDPRFRRCGQVRSLWWPTGVRYGLSDRRHRVCRPRQGNRLVRHMGCQSQSAIHHSSRWQVTAVKRKFGRQRLDDCQLGKGTTSWVDGQASCYASI